MSKVKVLVDSTFKNGVTLYGKLPVVAAYDAAMRHAPPQEWSALQLRPGVNECDLDEVEAWRARAADAGLIFSKVNNVYTLSNGIGADCDPAPETVIERALASNRVVSVL